MALEMYARLKSLKRHQW